MSRYYNQSQGKAPTHNYNKNTSLNYGAGSYGNQTQSYGNQPVSKFIDKEEQLLKSSFALFDLDGSKKISKDEFKSTVRCLGYTASDEEIEKMITTFDKNGDGMMDFKEFKSLMKHLKNDGYQYGKQALEKDMKNAFRVLDADGDGYLTPRELRRVLCNTGNRLTRDEIDDFVRLFDKDNDGRISYNELIGIMCTSLEDHIQQLIP